jgi:hypothetical protein
VVSLSYSPQVDRSDRLHQSVDLALQELLGTGDDPLALSFYLWTLKKHRHSLINLGNLTSWGMARVRSVFVERQVGRRRDEDIASAALCLVALANTSALGEIRGRVREGVEQLLDAELTRNAIPLRRPAYGVLFLHAAHTIGVEGPRVRGAAERAACALVEAVPGGRLFGLVFAAELLQAIGDGECSEKLERSAVRALADDGVDFEDQVYLLQALWQLRCGGGRADEAVMRFSEQLLNKAPAWQYLMNGVEDVPPAGDGRAVVYISHLYRGALLDVLLRYQTFAAARLEEQLDSRYRGRAGVSWSAFGFYVLGFLLAWAATAYFMLPATDSAGRYWLLGDFTSMRPVSAISYLVGLLWAAYLFILTLVIMPTAYSVFVKSKIGSDQRIKDVLGAGLWRATKIWFAAIAFALVFGVFTNIIAPSAQHLFKREAWSLQNDLPK